MPQNGTVRGPLGLDIPIVVVGGGSDSAWPRRDAAVKGKITHRTNVALCRRVVTEGDAMNARG